MELLSPEASSELWPGVGSTKGLAGWADGVLCATWRQVQGDSALPRALARPSINPDLALQREGRVCGPHGASRSLPRPSPASSVPASSVPALSVPCLVRPCLGPGLGGREPGASGGTEHGQP